MTTTSDQVEDVPGKPYKAIVAGASSAAAAALSLGLNLPDWLTVTLTVLSAGGGAYIARNPKRRKRR